jgi:hypothetical protein
VPAAYNTEADISSVAIYGSVRVPIAEFTGWQFGHPSFLTADGHVHPDTEFHGNYGLWGICAGCHYRYASTVLAILSVMDADRVLFNAHSAKSAEDADALMQKRCPRCGNPDLLVIMVDVPDYVREAIGAEKRRRGL